MLDRKSTCPRGNYPRILACGNHGQSQNNTGRTTPQGNRNLRQEPLQGLQGCRNLADADVPVHGRRARFVAGCRGAVVCVPEFRASQVEAERTVTNADENANISMDSQARRKARHIVSPALGESTDGQVGVFGLRTRQTAGPDGKDTHRR